MSGDESLILRPQLKWVPWVFAVCLTAAVTGLGLGLDGQNWAWAVFGIALIPAALSGVQFHENCHFLQLTRAGLTLCRWGRARFHPWSRVKEIAVIKSGGGKVVRVELHSEGGATLKPLILRDDFQMSPDALAALLRRWPAKGGALEHSDTDASPGESTDGDRVFL